jgi:hypothetical protein
LDYKNPTDEESTSVAACQISPDFKAYRKHFRWQYMGSLGPSVDVLGIIATPVLKEESSRMATEERDSRANSCRITSTNS